MVKSIADPCQRLFDLCSRKTGKDLCAEIAKALADDPARINATNDCGDTPLICALQYENVELANVLLEFDADVTAKGGHGQTALIAAAEKGLAEMCALLVDKGANVNAIDEFGNTALMSAIGFEHAEICTALLPCGVIDARHGQGYTALLLAFFSGDLATSRLLIEHGATTSPEDWEWKELRDIRVAIERLISRPELGKHDLVDAEGRIKDEVLFAASDCSMWMRLFAVLQKESNLFEPVWDNFPSGLQERLKVSCPALSSELHSRILKEQVKKVRKGTKWLERPDNLN